MAIPDYQAIMLPLLKHLGDGQERSNADSLEALAAQFGLTEEERKELLSSGQRTFANRLAWAKTYLKQAGLIEAPRRGCHKITERGIKVLKQNPQTVNNDFLMQFSEFAAFMKRTTVTKENDLDDDKTPQEHVEYGYQEIRRELADEVLKRIKECHPNFFERLVVDLVVAMGYGGSRRDAGKAIGTAGDGGIDGIIKEDKLGLEAIYIQAKRWDGNVSRPEVQKFAGALAGQQAKKGIFITTSGFTKEAEEYVQKIDSRIVLINGTQLAELMIDHDIGVTRVASYDVKRIDSDYFGTD